MIADENSIIQKLGWRRLRNLNIKWMASLGGSTGVRCFDILKIIFNDNSIHHAFDWSVWQNEDNGNIIYPYPFQWANKATPKKFEILDITCHSHAVERHFKIVSDA